MLDHAVFASQHVQPSLRVEEAVVTRTEPDARLLPQRVSNIDRAAPLFVAVIRLRYHRRRDVHLPCFARCGNLPIIGHEADFHRLERLSDRNQLSRLVIALDFPDRHTEHLRAAVEIPRMTLWRGVHPDG